MLQSPVLYFMYHAMIVGESSPDYESKEGIGLKLTFYIDRRTIGKMEWKLCLTGSRID